MKLLRHELLDTEALYELISEGGGVITATVVQAPGLDCGTRVRLLSSAFPARERRDLWRAA